MGRVGAAPQVLPEQDHPARQRLRDGDEEEEEAGRERLIGGHAELTEEADEERLAHGEPVQRERDEQDEEEERPHDVVDERREIDPDRLGGGPDRQHANRLKREGEQEDRGEEAAVAAED